METPTVPVTPASADEQALQVLHNLSPAGQSRLIQVWLESQGKKFDPNALPAFLQHKKGKVDPQGHPLERLPLRRGSQYMPHAEAFAQQFPLSAEWLPIERFDQWAGAMGYYTYLPHKEYEGKYLKRKTEWMAMLRWRDMTIKGINDAALTRRMEESGFGAFGIERKYNHFRRVLPYVHASDIALHLDKVPDLAKGIRESLEEALMATPYVTQHTGVKYYVATLHAEIVKYENEVRSGYVEINNKHHGLLRLVRTYVELGWMPVDDPLVKALLPHAQFAPDKAQIQGDDASAHVPMDAEQPYC
jgi:hypothetical protein